MLGRVDRVTVPAMSHEPAPSVVTELTLVIPATNDHIRFARLMASAVAARVGLDYDTIEDLRIAVSELCTAVTEAAMTGDLTLTYRGDESGVTIAGRVPRSPGSPAPGPPDDLTLQMLQAVSGEHTIDVGVDEVKFALHLRSPLPPAT